MATRFYLVPVISAVSGTSTFRSPKYFGGRSNPPLDELVGLSWDARDFGDEPYMIVGADVTSTQHTALATQADVLAVPLQLDNNVGAAALNQIRNAFENANIPGTWIASSSKYLDVIRFALNCFTLLQRFQQSGIRLFVATVTLDTKISQIDSGTRNQLDSAAASLGLSTTLITGTTTLRDALKYLADQMPSTTLAGVTF